MIIRKKSVYRHIIRPLKNKGYNIKIVGGISYKGYSKNDIDLLIKLPIYPKADKIFKKFEKDLKKLKWQYVDTQDSEKYGIEHIWVKKNKIILEIFINEAI